MLSAADWEVLEVGLVQRSRLLDAVLADLYGSRSLLTDGMLPPELVFAHPVTCVRPPESKYPGITSFSCMLAI